MDTDIAYDMDPAVRTVGGLVAQGIPADRIIVDRSSVQVRYGWASRPSLAATRLLRSVGAVEEMGSAVEPEGREVSARTEDGTWVYIPCRPLTPFADLASDAAASRELAGAL